MPADPSAVVRILHVPACPLLPAARTAIRRVAADLGIAVQVDEIEGAYRSPTVIAGTDRIADGDGAASCQLEVPNDAELRAVILRAAGRAPREPR